MGSLEHNELRTDLTNFNRQFNRLPTTQEYQEDDKLKVQSVFQRHRRKPKRNHARFHRHINITKVLILPKYLNLTHLRSLKTAIHIIKVTHIDQFFVLKSLTKHCLYYITTTLKRFASVQKSGGKRQIYMESANAMHCLSQDSNSRPSDYKTTITAITNYTRVQSRRLKIIAP